MPIHLIVTCDETHCRVALAESPESPLAETARAELPDIQAILGDPPGTPNRRQADPYGAGYSLYQALGGDALWERLDASDDGLLLLECDASATALPWEYAASRQRRFLSCDFGMLRLEPRQARISNPTAAPRLLVVCADPLVYPDGQQPSFALDFQSELHALRQALEASSHVLPTHRVPPTPGKLREALAGGPLLMHFSCQGNLVPIMEADGRIQQDVTLVLENEHGEAQPLLGRDLLRSAPRGLLRMVLLSACQSAPLAQTLVRDGVPLALGMQHTFPDPLSDDLVAAFYRFLSAGNDVAEAVRQARLSLAEAHPSMLGLLVAYSCQNAWAALPLPAGQPDVQLALSPRLAVPENVLPPSVGLLGRATELLALAKALSESKVATVVGAGGMGKTSLAAAFIRRFGWRFRRVLGVSFAGTPVDEARVCRALIEAAAGQAALQQAEHEQSQLEQQIAERRRRLVLLEERAAKEGMHTDPAVLTEIEDIRAILEQLDRAHPSSMRAERLRQHMLDLIMPGDLILLDNYESVLTPEPGTEASAAAVARLPWLLLDRNVSLLITSRATPCGLPDERLVPDRHGMHGLASEPAIELFLRRSSKASNSRMAEDHSRIAAQVAQTTEGYPLAVQLLAAAYDAYSGEAETFLRDWPVLLKQASASGIDPRHASFAAAVSMSLTPLTEQQRERLCMLAGLAFPFFAEAAALLWEPPADQDDAPTTEALSAARDLLHLFVQRSLLEVEDYLNDDEGQATEQPATYRFQPALRQELLRRTAGDPTKQPGYAAYGAWLARHAYGQIGRDPALAQLIDRSWPVLDAASDRLAGEARLWHIHRLASFRQQFGALSQAHEELEQALEQAAPESAVRSELLYQQASIYRVQGEMEQAMQLYQQSLRIYETLQDVQSKSATLHAMASIYVMQGDLSQAMQLYQESLHIYEGLQDLKGKSATLHEMAYIYRLQGDLSQAMQLYQESLRIHEALNDQQGKSATLNMMANIHMARKNWPEVALVLNEALSIAQKLGDMYWIAFNTVKLGQLAQAQGDNTSARQRYMEGLAIHERLKMPRETEQVREMLASLEQQEQLQTLSDLISAWITDKSDEQSRLSALSQLLNTIANITIQVMRAGDQSAAQQIAAELIPLRVALQPWPASANLPPFNAFLGCLQALLRGQAAQLTRLRTQLDEGLAQALAQVEQAIDSSP